MKLGPLLTFGIFLAACTGAVADGAGGGGTAGGGPAAGGGVAAGGGTGASGGGGGAGGPGSGTPADSGGDAGADAGGQDSGIALPPFVDRCVRPSSPQPPAPLRTLWVDSASGLDSNDGRSPSTAWKTLAKANNSVAPGDLVWVSGFFDGGY